MMRQARRYRVSGLLCCLISLTAAAAPAADVADCPQALTLYEWQPFVALGSARDDSAAGSALANLRRFISAERVAATATQPDKETAALEHQLWQALRSYDMDKLYHTLPDAQPPWRSLYLKSELDGSVYRVHRVAPGAGQLSYLGDSLGDVGMRPAKPGPDAPYGDQYDVRAHWQLATGAMRWSAIRRAQTLGLDGLVSPVPLAHVEGDTAAASQANPKLSAADARRMGELWQAFPKSWAWYASIGQVERLTETTSSADYQHLSLSLALDDQRLGQRYPAVDDYLDRLGNLVTMHTVVRNAQGQWLKIDLDSKTRRLSVEAWLSHGQLVPTRHGRAVADYQPTKVLRHGRFDTVTTLEMRAFGIEIDFNDLPMHWSYTRDDQQGRFSGWLKDKPEVTVSGRAFGLIPAGVLETLMPKNISDFMDDFLSVLTASNDGQGAHLDVAVSDRADLHNRLALDASARVLDNFFIHFGVQMINKRVLPPPDALVQLRGLIGDGLTAFLADLDRRVDIGQSDQCRTNGQ